MDLSLEEVMQWESGIGRVTKTRKVLLGIGGGHYAPRHMDIVPSFKGWQKNAITGFLTEQNIKVGKPNDFI